MKKLTQVLAGLACSHQWTQQHHRCLLLADSTPCGTPYVQQQQQLPTVHKEHDDEDGDGMVSERIRWLDKEVDVTSSGLGTARWLSFKLSALKKT